MPVVRRVYLYGIALVAFGVLVSGLTGLLEIGFALIAERLGPALPSIGLIEIRDRVSLAGSLTAIGLIVWLIHWGLADRSARRPTADGRTERRSAIRKFFLYLILAVGAVFLGTAGARLTGDLLRAAFGLLTWSDLLTGAIVQPITVLFVWLVFWLYYQRVASQDRQAVREVGAAATIRRWYVYAISFFGLLYFLFAASGLFAALWEVVIVPPGQITLDGDWLRAEVATAAGRILAGLVLWGVLWTWSTAWFNRATDADADPENRSVLRKVYLYLVLAVVVAWSVWNAGRILYLLLSGVLIPERLAQTWVGVLHELGPAVAAVAVFGTAWVYHARVVGREAAISGERNRQAAIRWFYDYLVALVGLLVLAVGLGGVAATLVDLLVQPDAVRPTFWWEERISLFATLAVVGLPLWFWVWLRIEREAQSLIARRSLVRRLYLFLVFALSVLTLLGSGAVTLYQIIRLLLGERWTAGQTSTLLEAASAVVVAAILLVYHARLLRRDLLSASAAVPTPEAPEAPVIGLALVRAAGREHWLAFQRELPARLPPGVAVELEEVSEESAERLWASAKAGEPKPDGRTTQPNGPPDAEMTGSDGGPGTTGNDPNNKTKPTG